MLNSLCFARMGGKEKYFHCDKCGYCLDKSMLETHLCRTNSSKDNCPVCMEVRISMGNSYQS